MTEFMRQYERTVHLLESHGLPERVIGRNTIAYFLTVEHKSPVEVAVLMLGARPVVPVTES